MKAYAQYIIKLARALRKCSTVAEKMLWKKLRNRSLGGLKFKRQHPIERYIVDFYCDELKLIVEVEGGIHNEQKQILYDRVKFRDLALSGHNILRIQNDEVFKDINSVLEKIINYKNLSPSPSPIRRGERMPLSKPGVRLPLSGKTILITRSKEQAKDFIQAIESRGGNAISFPTISIEDPDSWKECDDAIKNISSFDGIIFTSQNAVNKFFTRPNYSLHSALSSKLIFSVGEKTKSAIEKYNLNVTTIPEVYTAESLGETMRSLGVEGKRFLFPRGNLGREVLVEMLNSLGAVVKPVIVFKTSKPNIDNADSIKSKILFGEIDIVTFTSPSAVKNFFSLFTEKNKTEFAKNTIFAVIGDITAEALKSLDVNPTIIAKPSTTEGMIIAIEKYLSIGLDEYLI